MTKYSKFNVIYRLQKWLDSVPGQTFMNYAYSWGASIVILGALFKLTHLPGANLMLFLGMGTEVLVFFIAGFDRPFDKTEEGKELPTHVTTDIEGAVVTSADGEPIISEASTEGATVVSAGGIIGGGGGVVGGGGGVIGGGEVPSAEAEVPSSSAVVEACRKVPLQLWAQARVVLKASQVQLEALAAESLVASSASSPNCPTSTRRRWRKPLRTMLSS